MYKCRNSSCQKTFALANNRCKHERKCSNGEKVININNLTCSNWCGKKFTTKYNFDRHVLICEDKSEVKLFSCLQCPKTFPSSSKLTLHEKVHSMKEIFICQNCSNTYVRKDKLEIHSRIWKNSLFLIKIR